jgi:hypothetical protein
MQLIFLFKKYWSNRKYSMGKNNNWEKLFKRAHQAGRHAANRITPRMPCGYTWIKIPGRTSFARWARLHGIADYSRYHGVTIHSHWEEEGRNSYHQKAAYAIAFANILKKAGIDAYADGVLD